MLTYKAKLYGMSVERTTEEYTSQTCPSCSERRKPSGRNYVCPECGFEGHRDAVGAANIRDKYLRETGVVADMASASACEDKNVQGVKYRPHMPCSSRSNSNTTASHRSPAVA